MTKHQALLMALLAFEPSLSLTYSREQLLAHALTMLNRLRIVAHVKATEDGANGD